jgi:Fe-S-cluster containining protein
MKSHVDDLGELLSPHVGRADILADVDAVYADIDRFVSANGLSCQACGSCCRFGQFGHRLFVTAPELVYFQTKLFESQGVPSIRGARPSEGLTCPFQTGEKCGVRAIRPADCRIFFCGQSFSRLVQTQCEQVHARLVKICETRSLPYVYVDWTKALTAILPDEH